MVIMVPYVPALELVANCLTLCHTMDGPESLAQSLDLLQMVSYSFIGEMVLFIEACPEAGK